MMMSKDLFKKTIDLKEVNLKFYKFTELALAVAEEYASVDAVTSRGKAYTDSTKRCIFFIMQSYLDKLFKETNNRVRCETYFDEMNNTVHRSKEEVTFDFSTVKFNCINKNIKVCGTFSRTGNIIDFNCNEVINQLAIIAKCNGKMCILGFKPDLNNCRCVTNNISQFIVKRINCTLKAREYVVNNNMHYNYPMDNVVYYDAFVCSDPNKFLERLFNFSEIAMNTNHWYENRYLFEKKEAVGNIPRFLADKTAPFY